MHRDDMDDRGKVVEDYRLILYENRYEIFDNPEAITKKDCLDTAKAEVHNMSDSEVQSFLAD